VTLPDGLTLIFTDRMLTGWRFDGPASAYPTRRGLTTGDKWTARGLAAGAVMAKPGPDGRISQLSAGPPRTAAL